MSENHWLTIERWWARLGPPQRPGAEVVAAVRALLAGIDGPGLLLGVTPEYADLLPEMTAIDRSRAMIDHIWPGDTERRRALQADWLTFEAPPGRFAAAIGDGSLNSISFPDQAGRLFARLAAMLRPGGRVVIRVYATPAEGETLSDLPQAVLRRRVASIHSLKWRLAMALVRQSGEANLAVTAIRDAFLTLFSDRARLAAATGWSEGDIATIDMYENSREVYCFPTRAQLLAAVPPAFRGARFVDAGSYDLAAACPLLVTDRA